MQIGMAQSEDDIPGLLGDLIRFGTVETVNDDGTAIVRSGKIVSPPLPWPERAGNFRTWFPPSVGEQVILICPEGDIAGGFILPGLFCAAYPKLGTGENPQLHGPDGLIITLTGDGLRIVAPGGLTIEGDVTVTGTVTASEDVIGGDISLKSHKHGGVQAGGAQTGGPA